jgi:putative transposase
MTVEFHLSIYKRAKNMKLLKTYQYRLYPTKKQLKALQLSLDACRWVYNKTLETRKQAWEEKKESLGYYNTVKLIPGWKEEKPDLANAYSQCLQTAQLRIDLAFKSFFRRVKKGEKPGYPRFKGSDRYDSFMYPQNGFQIIDNRLKLSKIGSVRIKKSREIEGVIKTLTVRRSGEKWYANFCCEIQPNILAKVEAVVGIDVGLTSFATLSSGEKIENPRFFREAEVKLAKAQRRLSKSEKGSPDRKKQKRKVANIHTKIANKRKDFAHKLSRQLVNEYQVIAFEKLNIQNMMSNHTECFGHKLNKSIGDASWNQFIAYTTYKAEWAGRTVVMIDPRNTSKMCSRCGQLVEKPLSCRVHSCSCGLILDRDHNAALNILRLGMESLAKA